MEDAFAGSRIRPREAPVEPFSVGKSPVTYATPLESMAAPWSKDLTLGAPLGEDSVASAAQMRTVFWSYAAKAPSMSAKGVLEVRNFDGSNFSAVQSGLPAE